MSAPATPPVGEGRGLGDLDGLVVCSLEAWDEVWRRNQFLADELLRRNPSLRMLFVEPAQDLLHELRRGRVPAVPRLRPAGSSGRLWTLRPVKPLPQRAGPWTDLALRTQVRQAARRLKLNSPALWVNDTAYAPLIATVGWPALYDVTDDWLLASAPPRILARLERLEAVALRDAAAVVVCSPDLARTRGAHREVTLIPNGVDVAHMRRPRTRPDDLPGGPVAVYVGTLHDERVDVALVAELAEQQPRLRIALVGPDALSPASRARLDALPAVTRLGPRPYADVPAYLQHADVIVVPHQITPFTESLDPIKAYECLAVGTPTVATEVAGFRGLGANILTAPRFTYVEAVAEMLEAPPVPAAQHTEDISWHSRAAAFEAALRRASRKEDDRCSTR